MLIRISLIVAIIAGLAVGVLDFVIVRDKITTLQTKLASTQKERDTAKSEAVKSKNEMVKAKAELEATNQVLQVALVEREKAVNDAAAQTRRATTLADELTKTKKDRDDAQAELAAFHAIGLPPEQVRLLGNRLKQTQDELAAVQTENSVLAKKVGSLTTELEVYRGNIHIVYLPANLKGKILVCDPKWDFVVLNVGEDQGVRANGELLVNRNGQLVAKVIVRSIQKDRCIANVLPGWKLGEPMEGDLVIPAHPES